MPMPKDSNGQSIQMLAPGTSVILSPNADSDNSTLSGAKTVMVSASGDVWLKFGASGVTASAAAGSTYLPGGVAFFAVPSSAGVLSTHLAAYAADAQTVCVTPLE